MLGVVLWSHAADRKAVIWCEDHGDLAFYSGDEDETIEGFALDAGDLVRFEVTERKDVRHARNPRLVAQQQYPTLGADLKVASGIQVAPTPTHSVPGDGTGQVIRFPQRNRPAPEPSHSGMAHRAI